MGADERRRQEGFGALRPELSPENSLGNAVHVAGSAMVSAAGFALVGAVGARLAVAMVPRVSREVRWMAPSLTASIAAILGAQQGTLQALADVQPTASFALLRADLDEALANEALLDKERGGNRETTFVMREYKSWTPFWVGERPAADRVEVHAHSNTIDREAVARHMAAAERAAAGASQRVDTAPRPRAIPRPAMTSSAAQTRDGDGRVAPPAPPD